MASRRRAGGRRVHTHTTEGVGKAGGKKGQ